MDIECGPIRGAENPPPAGEFVRDAVLGLLILLAVVLDGLLSRRFVHRRTIMAAEGSGGGPPAPAAEVEGNRQVVGTGWTQ